MVKFCCVVGCSNRSQKSENLRFFNVPKVISQQGDQTIKISSRRRDQWLANIRRDDVSKGVIKNPLVCSIHFHKGEPAAVYKETDPDWAPSIAMGHSSGSVSRSCKESSLKRYKRALNRSSVKKRIVLGENQSQNVLFEQRVDDVDAIPLELNEENKQTKPETVSIEVQTDMTLQDIEKLEKQGKSDGFLSKKSVEKDEEKLKFYTGLTTMSVFLAVLELISPGLTNRASITKFQQLLLTLMRLRLNLNVQDLGYRFGINPSTVSRVFKSCIGVMYSSMYFLVHWPDRDALQLTMPASFRLRFSSCAVIIDCFEVFLDRPSDLLARALTWSSYKHHNTAKFLIGITPQGTVSFISKAWGGRASDKFITEHCGLLDNLLPGDLVLADRGFDIEDSCGLYAARLKIPAFTRGKQQLAPLDIETTRTIANVRIHVERVIGCVRQKYSILGHSIVPIDYVKTDNDSSPCLLDQIAFVCCALTNICKSVVSPD